MRRSLVLLLAVAALITAMIAPASAITDGEPDGDGHPEVVLIIMDVDGEPAWRCSGTLIAPTYVLTAGHCAGATGEFSGIRIFTESDVQNGNNTYPFAHGPNSIEAVRWASLPGYDTGPWFAYDAGMIELSKPYELDTYGALPDADILDAYATRRGHHKAWFTAVGYGLQQSFPDPAYWKTDNVKVRYVAYPKLNQINAPGFTGDFSMLLSNNAHTGGTCFGDSGGPNFLKDTTTVAGVTSYGLNGNCAGTGGVFRIDRQPVLEFINGFMNP